MEQQYLLNLEQLLKQVSSPSPDNKAILQATELLKKNYFNSEQCIPALVEIISSSKDMSIRHLASVELPKRVKTHFTKLDDNLKSQIEQRLLEIITVEPEKIISHAIARCISAIAEYEIKNQRWGNLIDFLFQCCQSTNPSHREVGVFVLYSLFEVIYEYLSDKIPQIFELFSHTINDPESIEVKITTIKALEIIAEYIDDENTREIELYRSLIPNMVNVLQQCLELNNEEGIKAGFDVIESLLISETSIISDHFTQFIQLTIDIAKNQQYTENIRNMALTTIFFTIVYKKNKLIRLELCKPIIDGIFPIGVEDEPEDEDEDSPCGLVYRILNTMSSSIPPNYIFPIIMEYITNYMQNPNAMYRKAALMSLWNLVDGCAELILQKINDILSYIASGLQDPEPVVRKAACLAFYFISKDMIEEVSVHHASFIPLIFNLMNDQDLSIQKHATNALSSLLEGLNDNIVQYLPMLADKFINLLDTGAVENKAIIVEAIGSAALSANDKFLNYFEAFYPRIINMMSYTTGTDELLIRGVATNTMGFIAEAVGKEVFRPYVQDTMKLAMDGLIIDSPKLKEQSFYYFAILAKVFGNEFTPYLSAVMPPIIKSLNQSEDFDSLIYEEYLNGEMDEEEAEEKADQLYSTSNAIAEEKELAAECVHDIFAATKNDFMPYFEPCVESLKKLINNDFEGVRKAAATSLLSIISTCNEMCGTEKWQPGLPLKVQINQDVATLIDNVMPDVIKILEDEESKDLVFEVLGAIDEELKSVGPALIAGCHKELANILLNIFNRTHTCQIDFEDDEESQEEKLEETEYESIVISNASNVLGTMALVLGNEFLEYFRGFFQPILNFYNPSKAATERNTAIIVFGEVATGLKEQITEFTERILQVLLVALKDEDNCVNSNAAYALGKLCEFTTMDISSYYPEIFSSLYPLFGANSLPKTIDNACGCVCRLLLRNPNAIPIEQVLPTFFGALPLKADYEENVPVVHFLKYLLESQNPFVLSNKADMANLFQAMLSPPENQLTDECRDLVMKMAQSL